LKGCQSKTRFNIRFNVRGLLRQVVDDRAFFPNIIFATTSFKAAPVHVAILDKRQQSAKGPNSGSEGVIRVHLTVQKPAPGDQADGAAPFFDGGTQSLIEKAISELSAEHAKNASVRVCACAGESDPEHLTLDSPHFSDDCASECRVYSRSQDGETAANDNERLWRKRTGAYRLRERDEQSITA
jgi:hypothetical protein